MKRFPHECRCGRRTRPWPARALAWANATRTTTGIRGVLLAAALSVLTAEGAAAQDGAGLSERATSGLDLPVREVRLDNGMRFLLLPRPG
ncbi:MAG: hypothetical protein KJP18_04670, partial [Gemmatimonadetes bacterium]|nr:hypothetical protein [Gemmatimonadota bacterium]